METVDSQPEDLLHMFKTLLNRVAGNYPVFRQKAFAVESKVTFDYCVVFLNGAVLHRLADLDTELKEGDKVMLIPNIYGG